MVSADGKSREVALNHFPTVIGRGEECKVRIPLSAVSRKHCELVLDDDEVVVRDLKSANGTYVNGMKVLKRELVPGDLLAIGPVVFVLRLNGHPKEIDAKECYAAGMVEPRDQAPPKAPGAASAKGAASADPGGSSSMVDGMAGVPTWGGGAKPKEAAASRATSGPASKPAASKQPDNDDSDGLGSLLADLDLSGLDDDEPEPPKKK